VPVAKHCSLNRWSEKVVGINTVVKGAGFLIA